MGRLLSRIVELLGSYGLCVTLLAGLFVLTLFGTLEQRYASIYDVQRTYFESLFLTEVRVTEAGAWPVLLPGGYTLLSILAVNLLVGGIVRVRKSAAALGVALGAVGLLALVLGWRFSTGAWRRIELTESTASIG